LNTRLNESKIYYETGFVVNTPSFSRSELTASLKFVLDNQIMRILCQKENMKMKKQWFAITITAATTTTALLVLFWLMADSGFGISTPALAAPLSLTVTAVDPAAAPNDIDTPIVIQGSGFTATLSGTVVITAPLVYLGDDALPGVIWVNSTTLSATVPWGLSPQGYTLTVVNPDGISATLQNAFTVTNGIGMWATGGPYGGSVEDIAVHPLTPTTVFATVFQIGVFASFDSAASWEMILANGWPIWIGFDAQDPDVIYSASDEGLPRSLDGGLTWELLPELFHSQNGCYTTYPVPHPTATGVVYAGTGRCEGIPLEPGEGGIYYSDDYGDTWVARTVGLTDTDIVDIAFHPDDPDTMAAATHSGNIFTTTNGGLTWHWAADLNTQLRRIYFNPSGSHEAWIVPYAEYQPPSAPYLFKSTDSGLSAWITTVVTDTLIPSGGIWSLTFISDTVWAAGERGYTSDDGGASWTPVMDDESPINPINNHTIKTFAFHPGDEQTIYAGSEMDGVARSVDGGVTWEKRNKGLAGLQIRELATPRGEIDTIYVNTFERGILRSDNGGQAWVELVFVHGGRSKGQLLSADPFVPDRVYLGSGCDGDIPCIQISEDRGVTWRGVAMTLPITWAGGMGELMTAVPHPLVPGRILVSAGFCRDTAHCNSGNEPNGFYASDDYGESWSYLGPTTPISEVLNIAYDSRDPNLVYAGTQGMGLWKSIDGGADWQAAPIPGVLPPVYVADIESHPHITGTVYVRIYSYAGGPNPQPHLFVSDDAGITWQEIPDVDTVFGGGGGVGLVFTPPMPDSAPYSLYTGCDPGLCRSSDGGNTWEHVEGAPRPAANSNNPALAAGTDGQRVRLYIGTPGGMVSQAGAQTASTQNAISSDVTIFGGGVYRLTTLLPTNRVYLTFVMRE
jgi:photosystem II stability/assembly factor-like uncharacterized protein